MPNGGPMHPPAGWYPDQSGRQRWWDGAAWGAYAPAPQLPSPYTAPGAMVGYSDAANSVPMGYPLIVRAAKDVGIAYLFVILLGTVGAHRFYLGRIGSAIAMLLMTIVGWMFSVLLIGIPLLIAVGVWIIVDLFLIPSMVREANFRR